MNVNEMTREQLRDAMRASREIHTFSETAMWKRAFQLFEQGGNGPVHYDCGSCQEKVKEWLEK